MHEKQLNPVKHILIVDDDSQICGSLSKVLLAEGYYVESATDAHEAIKKFIVGKPDLVLLDLNLPDGGGWEMFGAFTAVNPCLPVMIITGRQHQAELAMQIGVGAFMEKPLDVPLLLETIADLIAEEPQAHLQRLMGANR